MTSPTGAGVCKRAPVKWVGVRHLLGTARLMEEIQVHLIREEDSQGVIPLSQRGCSGISVMSGSVSVPGTEAVGLSLEQDL